MKPAIGFLFYLAFMGLLLVIGIPLTIYEYVKRFVIR